MAYRSAEHETTGMSPNMLMLGREVSTPLDLIFEMPSGIKPIPDHEWVWELRERNSDDEGSTGRNSDVDLPGTDDIDKNDDLTDIQSNTRTRRKPVWAKDYVFSYLRSKMPKIKTTVRTNPLLPICPVCKTSIQKSEKIEAHVEKCNRRDELERTCKVCNKVMMKYAYLKKHMKLVHKVDGSGYIEKGHSDKKDWDKNPDIELDFKDSESENEEKCEANYNTKNGSKCYTVSAPEDTEKVDKRKSVDENTDNEDGNSGQREVEVSICRSDEESKKRQKIVIIEEGEVNYESNLLCPAKAIISWCGS
ncbi:uncharacterized protein LOC128550072 [Mercenaria mercenaria]|uniref:uncharacterized protein LOC128550072 n=1 Tax=Mercenaria mercenaria TaxID=6596 RepID=UPI00234F6138|nr:uncharacterized protein LOC128550072 [Mercenaria mercenaria]